MRAIAIEGFGGRDRLKVALHLALPQRADAVVARPEGLDGLSRRPTECRVRAGRILLLRSRLSRTSFLVEWIR